MPHLPFTLLLALLISGATACLGNRPTRQRIHHASYVFLSCTIAVLAGSWIMYWIHG